MTWQEALSITWAEFRGLDPEPGAIDCCQFVDRYAELLTGRRYGAGFEYTSMRAAVSILDDHAGMVALFDELVGRPHRDEGEPGDVVVFESDGIDCAGILSEYCITFIHPTNGIARKSTEHTAAWQLQ